LHASEQRAARAAVMHGVGRRRDAKRPGDNKTRPNQHDANSFSHMSVAPLVLLNGVNFRFTFPFSKNDFVELYAMRPTPTVEMRQAIVKFRQRA
jgi:hypothetical protein